MARPRGDIRERVVHAARRVFLAHGVEGASLRDIAARAKTNIGMVYYYFPSKKELFEAVVDEVYPTLLAGIEEALAPDAPVPARIERLFLRMGELSSDEQEVIRILMSELLRSPSKSDELVHLGMRGHMPLILRTVMEGMTGGSIRTDVHPAAVMLAIVAPAFMVQLVRRLIGDRAPKELGVPEGEALSHALAALVLDGVRGRDERRTPSPKAPTGGAQKRVARASSKAK